MTDKIARLKAERKSKKTEMTTLSREVKKTCRKKIGLGSQHISI